MRFKTMKSKDGGVCLRRVVYVVMGDSGLDYYYYDSREEAEADCGASNWVEECFYDEVMFEGETE